MQFQYLTHIPAELDHAWFSRAYEDLVARLDALDERSLAASWLELAAHWNELKDGGAR